MTVMFADMRGFTRLIQTVGDAKQIEEWIAELENRARITEARLADFASAVQADPTGAIAPATSGKSPTMI